jgi:hypothetical protein
MEDSVLVFCGIAVFIVTNVGLRNFDKGRKKKFHQNAIRNKCIVQAVKIKEHSIIEDRSETVDTYRTAKNRAVYEYYVKGHRYRKKVTFVDTTSSVCTSPNMLQLYYDKRNPQYALTDEEILIAGKGPGFMILIPFFAMGITIYLLSHI